jgi:formate hydrogenlyase subunit 4
MALTGIILILLTAIIFPGIIGVIKAKIGGRKGPSVLQPLYDVIRLFKKGSIYSTTTSIIFKIAPLIYFVSVVMAVLIIPVTGQKGLISFEGDFVFFVNILAIGKFLMIIAAMDTGSSLEGMGANREALYSMLIEPAFFILMGCLALITKFTSFHDLYTNLHINTNLSLIIGISAVYVFIYIAMVENSRMPVDDPQTHLELTMVHEVMVLDNSGFDLALIQIAAWLKFTVYGVLISNFLISSAWPTYLQLAAFILIQIGFAVTVGFLESFRARNKLVKNPQWIIMLSAIAIVTFLAALMISQKLVLN